MKEHLFTTYVRTKTLFQNRLKDLKDYDAVKIYVYELKKLGVNNGPLLYRLKMDGQISYDNDGVFKALREGPIDPTLLNVAKKRYKVGVQLTDLHEYMRDQLRYVELPIQEEVIPVYFKAFIESRDRHLDAFFTVDAFAGRVHTPVVNLKGDLRKSLRFHGRPVVSLDVKQMQPAILAKVLLHAVGKNPFSDAIFNEGQDVYVLLQKEAHLQTRAEAKKLLFQLIFGKPMNHIGAMFKGNTGWVDWINSYKSTVEHKNPHKEDRHTNLAWLLQYSEVQVMSDIWNELRNNKVPFLTIHDDILCRPCDVELVHRVMEEELRKNFPKFDITVTT